ncbi:hypothetical protein BT69DRAFT_1344927 [Atractiella rhizophila]|nr:hypothetical protein BT69DRAFT_1344927 [Atractiella rhizophila]
MSVHASSKVLTVPFHVGSMGEDLILPRQEGIQAMTVHRGIKNPSKDALSLDTHSADFGFLFVGRLIFLQGGFRSRLHRPSIMSA